ncbi:MAG: DUF2079 domain-containing protein [Acidobacteriota bacterium]
MGVQGQAAFVAETRPSTWSSAAVWAWDSTAALMFVAWAGGIDVGPASRDYVAPKEVSLAAVGLLTVGALAIEWWTRRSVTDGLLFRLASSMFQAWQRAVSRRPASWLGLSAVLMAVVWGWASLRRHWAFGSNSFDLGIYTNALWNLTQGNGYVSSLKDGMHLLGDHQTPTYWLMAPLFGVWPAAEVLLIAQAVGFVTTGVALFYLAAQHYGRVTWASAALPLVFWCYLPTRNANAFDARPDSFMVPLLIWGIVGIQGRSAVARLGGAIALALALGCKETAALIGLMIGLAWSFGAGPAESRRFTRRAGVGLAVAAGAVFWFDVRVLPGLVGESYPYTSLYTHYGPRALDLALAPFLKADQFWWQLGQTENLSYLFWTLAPLGFLPLLDWTAWLLSSIGYLALFLANTPYRVDIAFPYSNEVSIGLWWALARVLPRLETVAPRTIRLWLAAWAIAASGGAEIRRVHHYVESGYTDWVRHELVPALHPTVTLAASDAFVPHVAARPWVRALHQLGSLPDDRIDCIMSDPSVFNGGLTGEDIDTIGQRALATGYRLELACGSLRLYSRSVSCLRHPLPCGL